jgi:hypothetical protein
LACGDGGFVFCDHLSTGQLWSFLGVSGRGGQQGEAAFFMVSLLKVFDDG